MLGVFINYNTFGPRKHLNASERGSSILFKLFHLVTLLTVILVMLEHLTITEKQTNTTCISEIMINEL